MIEPARSAFNHTFRTEQYQAMLMRIEQTYPHALDFRIAETPVFVPTLFKKKMLDTCSFILDQILEPDFKSRTEAAIPMRWRIPGAEGRPDFIAFDFGVCTDASGELMPQLIEMQGFPSLFGYQAQLDTWYRSQLSIDETWSPFFSGLEQDSYFELLRNIIIGDHDPKEVILLEILPEQQKTRIDFAITKDRLGIPVVCLTQLRAASGKLYYELDGKTYPVRRIYNRIIFDELEQQPDAIRQQGDLLRSAVDVEWCPHPHWFYRISKFLLPTLIHPGIPRTYALDQIKQLPANLSEFVLKPLFSFAGQGVIIDPTQQDLEQIPDPSNWILQRKATYAPIIPTPDDPAKVEIRLFYFWPTGADRPIPTLNLARLSKGKMVGTRYNKDRTWVGGSICYFES